MPRSANTADEYDFVDHEETTLSPEILAQIREWLQPTDYLADSGEFRRHLASKAPGTGLWICDTDEYRKWHDSPDHGSLWIKGVPGAGKSVMAASIIQHLRTTENCPVLFFFFRNIVAANFSPRSLIQDWLAQLLPYSPKLQFALQSRLSTKLEETSDNDLVDVFLDGVSCVPKLYCVGDALDEMTTENRPFLDKFNSLATHRPQSLKLLITSRPKQHLQSALRGSSIVHISLQHRLVDTDIFLYLRHRFDTASLSDNKLQIKQQLIDMVARRSEGLFLYAKLTMDQLEAALGTNGPVDVSALEQSLPVGLEQTYTSMLAKQRQEKDIGTEIQVLVLEAATHSSKPLRLNELAGLIKFIRPDLSAPSGFKDLVAACCGPLIEVLEDETLQVIHHSFTEFLRGDTRTVSKDDASSDFPAIDSLEAHKRMAINCLRYLHSRTLLLPGESATIPAEDLLPSPSSEQIGWPMIMKKEDDIFSYQEARLRHPFLGYAVENWSYHASHYDVKDGEFFHVIQDFIKPDRLAFRRWLALQWGSSPWKKGRGGNVPTVLHITAFAGLSELASELIQQGASASSTDDQGRVPLHWAAENGHAKVASLLIQHGCNPDAADTNGLKPLHLAAKKNHASVVTVLLAAGVEPSTVRMAFRGSFAGLDPMSSSLLVTEGESAIVYASEAGHMETVTAMIPFCSPETLEQLLCECCRFGRADCVLAILDKTEVSANVSHRGGSALHFACVSANGRCVEALINRGADVHKMSKWDCPIKTVCGSPRKSATLPLHDLVRVWNKRNNTACLAILKMLIKAGADLEQPDSNGNTALIKVVQPPDNLTFGGLHVPALKGVLDAGADVNTATRLGDTPLHVVADKNQDLEAVRLLIKHGADANQRNNKGETPFHIFMSSSNYVRNSDIENAKPILKFLLDNGADPECRDNHGWSPISKDSTKFGPEHFSLLFSKCKSESTKRNCWFSLANERDNARFAETLELMLAAGMDIDQKSKNGRSLYLCCLAEPEKRHILQRHGARTDILDNKGNNAIHLLIPRDRKTRSVLESLFAEGLDPLSTNDNGDTLLHHAASFYLMNPKDAEHVRWLISLGIPVNAVNKQGDTALHLFMKNSWQGYNSRGEHADFINVIKESNGIDFEIRNNDGLTVVHMAVVSSGIQISKLMAAGADLSTLTKDSQNVLHLACRARKTSIVSQILGHLGNVNVNQADDFGRTPLHYACASGEAESVALLLKHGGNVNAVDSHGCTLLHACAEATAEQKIWDLQDEPFEWMRGPRQDPLRPSGSIKYPRVRQWIPGRYSTPQAPAPAVGAILKILLDAKLDPAATNRSHCTALDVSMQEGCAEFFEVFYRDEKLFDAATKPLGENRRIAGSVQLIQQNMKAQMAMMLPRSCLEILGRDKPAFDQVVKSPARFLELMSRDDAVTVINQGFEADPTSHSYYALLEELMKPGHLQLIERLSHVIAYYGTYEAVKEKMNSRGINQNRVDVLTPLQMACRQSECNMLTMQHLVEKLHVDVNAQFAHSDVNGSYKGKPAPGGTVLHILASADHHWQLEAMKYLIARGADVDALDGEHQSPIHIAARGKQYGHERIEGFWRSEALRILLDHGADPNVVDNQGHSPLHKASKSGDTINQLLQRGADPTIGHRSPVFKAIYDQNLAALEALLDHGLSVNTVDDNYQSSRISYSLKEPRKLYALLCAAFTENMGALISQSVPLLRVLVERGADLYLPLNDRETMIHLLFEVPSQYDVADTLLQEPCVSRIDFNRRDQLGRTVLMAACCWQGMVPGYSQHIKSPKARGAPLRILDCGADATLADGDGKTALHHLLDNPGIPDDVVVEFINREEVTPSLWLKDNQGCTAIHYALRTLRPGVCNLLLSKGAQVSEPDPSGLTVLHHISNQCLEVARLCRHAPTMRELPKDYFDQCLSLWQKVLAAGASINDTDSAGNTPLHTYLSSPERWSSRRLDPALCHVEHFNKLFPPDSGVDVSAVNHKGETALHIITARKNSPHGRRPGHDRALFEILLARGAEPLKEDAKGRSALDVASACGKDDIVGILNRRS
ncbi:hypothetical protein QQX98_007436 [Neonectria punicea]|uniref:Nephrocystin 3-like N-terminal domain-containing protein n=1 Tax=Neonectria punicea TaxID=979145 RepID=A0ABR1GXT9_9HYPO